jgi:hypothetical protein
MNRSTLILVLLAILAAFVAGYCFLAYVMAGSFSVAAGDSRPYARAAALWGVAGIASLVLALGLALAAWSRWRLR